MESQRCDIRIKPSDSLAGLERDLGAKFIPGIGGSPLIHFNGNCVTYARAGFRQFSHSCYLLEHFYSAAFSVGSNKEIVTSMKFWGISRRPGLSSSRPCASMPLSQQLPAINCGSSCPHISYKEGSHW